MQLRNLNFLPQEEQDESNSDHSPQFAHTPANYDFKDFIIAVGYGNISDQTMDLCVQKLSSA